MDTLFRHDGKVCEITGLRHVIIYRIEPGIRSVIDVMSNSGTRVTADVRHGVETGSATASMVSEVSSFFSSRMHMRTDPDFETIMEIVIRIMVRDGRIDVVSPIDAHAFTRVLVKKHVEAAWQGLNNRGVEYEDAKEGIQRYFSRPIDG